MLSLGIIGYKNHAKRITDILKKKYHIKYIFHPTKKINVKGFTNNIENLLKTNCIFILCPSKNHFFYLNYLKKKKYNGYIFFEKIPVTKTNDLKKISKFNNSKTFFNFNLRYSILHKFFKNSKLLGKLLCINIFDLKPIINKKEMKKNWRVNFKDTLITNNLVHYLDLIIYNFSKKIKKLNIISNKTNIDLKIIDNLTISFKISKKIFNINLSYSSGLEKLYLLYFSKGKIEINGREIKIYYPNHLTDNNGRLKNPNIYKKIKIRDIFNESNLKSINHFMNIVSNKKKIRKKDNLIAFDTNRLILQISKNLR